MDDGGRKPYVGSRSWLGQKQRTTFVDAPSSLFLLPLSLDDAAQPTRPKFPERKTKHQTTIIRTEHISFSNINAHNSTLPFLSLPTHPSFSRLLSLHPNQFASMLPLTPFDRTDPDPLDRFRFGFGFALLGWTGFGRDGRGEGGRWGFAAREVKREEFLGRWRKGEEKKEENGKKKEEEEMPKRRRKKGKESV